MDKNAFQTEMNRVAFTPAGREALTEALMEGAPAHRSMTFKTCWGLVIYILLLFSGRFVLCIPYFMA